MRFLNYLPSLATRHYSLITLVFCRFHRNVSRGGALDVQISCGLIDSADTYGFSSKCEDTCVLLTVVLHTRGHKHTLGGTHTWRYTHRPQQAYRANIIVPSLVIKKNTVSNQQSTLVQCSVVSEFFLHRMWGLMSLSSGTEKISAN